MECDVVERAQVNVRQELDSHAYQPLGNEPLKSLFPLPGKTELADHCIFLNFEYSPI